MSKHDVNIDLPESIAPSSDDPLAEEANPFIEQMIHALESERGIAITTKDKDSAMKLRFRFYNERKRQRSRGNKLFDGLEFTIHSFPDRGELHITRVFLPSEIREL